MIARPDNKLNEHYKVVTTGAAANYPWSINNSPIIIKTKGKRVPSWGLYNDMTGQLPYSIGYGLDAQKEEDIILVPYGCTRLRVSQFPVVQQ